MMNDFSFAIHARDTASRARTGCIHTPHGDIITPAFVPVGTQATIKSLTPEECYAVDVNLFFVNTYHMVLRPGIEVIKAVGGLHQFMGWNRPLITDSGGFQVFSLAGKRFARKNEEGQGEGSLVRITDDGVTFHSHWDGTEYVFTPENSMEYQWALGSDIHIAFDDCTPYGVTKKQAQTSMERTHAWATRSLHAHEKLRDAYKSLHRPYQALYGSIQGSIFEDLRNTSTRVITGLPFDGFAIGGVAVGETKDDMKHVLSWVVPHLPDDKPRHLLGVGEIDDVFALIDAGIDTFDCVQATRLARMGHLFVHDASVHFDMDILKSVHACDTHPIDGTCRCYTCTHYSRAYVHHLFHVRELLAYRLATIHNIAFMNQLVGDIRTSLVEGRYLQLKKQWMTV